MLGVMIQWLAVAELHWTAPAECPSQDEVQARLQEYLGGGDVRDDVVAKAQVGAVGDRWVLNLELRTDERSSTRSMTADDCRTLADTVALIVATFVERTATDERAEVAVSTVPPAPEPVPEPEPEPESASRAPETETPPPLPHASELAAPAVRSGHTDTSPPTPVTAPPRSSVPPPWSVRVGPTLGRATQVDLDLGAQVAISRRWRLARVSLGAVGLVPRVEPVPDREGVRLRRWLLAGRLEAGLVLPITRHVELPLDLGVEVGPVVARGLGVSRPRTAASPWLAAVGSIQLVWHATPGWGLWAGVDGLVGVLLPQFTVAGAGPLVAGASGLRATVGMTWRWGERGSNRDHHSGSRWPLKG